MKVNESIINPMTSAETSLYGVLGWPVSHSLSPAMHSRAILHMKKNAVYFAFPVHASRLEEAIRGLEAAGACGLNITAPHKERAAELISRKTEIAADIGAVNTFFRDADGFFTGDNTDVEGLKSAFSEKIGSIEGFSTVVIGAGGAAKAAAASLALAGAGRIIIANRTMRRAQSLAGIISGKFGRAEIIALSPEKINDYLSSARLIIQASSAPMNADLSLDYSCLSEKSLAVEMRYDKAVPESSAFLGNARKAGLEILGGTEVLAHQGAIAWDRWTGNAETGCLDVMKQFIRESGIL